jgi:hypothetical protein
MKPYNDGPYILNARAVTLLLRWYAPAFFIQQKRPPSFSIIIGPLLWPVGAVERLVLLLRFQMTQGSDLGPETGEFGSVRNSSKINAGICHNLGHICSLPHVFRSLCAMMLHLGDYVIWAVEGAGKWSNDMEPGKWSNDMDPIYTSGRIAEL